VITPEMIEAACRAYANGDIHSLPYKSGMEAAIEAALALLPEEPVAWLWFNDGFEQFTFGNRKPVDNATPLYAAPAPLPVAVKIKQLKWEEPRPTANYPEWQAHNLTVGFRALIDTHEPICFGKFPLRINGTMVKRKFSTVEAAKAYAQDKYEETVREIIRSALSSPAASDIAALRETIITDAIRSAYDAGYNDARNAYNTKRDSAKGYRGGDQSHQISTEVLAGIRSNLSSQVYSELMEENEALKVRNVDLEKRFASADWYWPEDDTSSDACSDGPWQIAENCDLEPGEVLPYVRGGVIEVRYFAYLEPAPDSDSDDNFEVDEPTEELAKERLSAEISRRSALQHVAKGERG